MFRVTTRADFDGLVSAALLTVVEDVDRYRFIEPGRLKAEKPVVTSEDLVANLPYLPGCAMWFDHHSSNQVDVEFRGSFWIAPSAARIIYDYYYDEQLAEYDELIIETDKIDSGQLTPDDVSHPHNYVLLSMTIDAKHEDDEPYWLHLIKLLVRNDLRKTMADPVVRQRCDDYTTVNEQFHHLVKDHSRVVGNVLVSDFAELDGYKAGNRFLPFALFPDIDIWINAALHPGNKVKISVGHSIFKRTSKVNVGEMLSYYGGGGHKAAGSCRIKPEDYKATMEEILIACRSK